MPAYSPDWMIISRNVVDDLLENVRAAERAGQRGRHFTGIDG